MSDSDEKSPKSGVVRMMLRSRNTNIIPAANGQGTKSGQDQAAKPGQDHPAKRAAGQQLQEKGDKENAAGPGGEPKPKRAALSELRNQLGSGLIIDSVKKGRQEEKVGRGKRSSNSSSDSIGLPSIHEENARSQDDSIMVIDDVVCNDPCPEYDYDAENIGDETNVPEYAFEIFRYYRQREKSFVVSDYLKKQHKITRDARAVLVDWMVEVQETFELNHETLYLAVKLVDLYLARTNDIVPRTQLQLIACAAIFIASKYDERSPPLIDDFLYVAEDSFRGDDLKALEMKMLKTVAFDLGSPLSYRFLRRFAKASHADMKILTVARYVLETSLMYYEYARSSESEVAAGAFLLGLRMCDASAQWTPVMHKYSGVEAAVAEAWCWELNHMLHVRNASEGVNARLKTCFQKYSHEVFFSAALIPLLSDKFSKSRPLEAAHRA